MNVKLCKCGCGMELKQHRTGRWPTWVLGHFRKGKKPHPNAIAGSIARMKGGHGVGRGARDNLNHHEAKHWIIRDNRGVIHECDNLQSWCRANEWRFLPDSRPESRSPIWRRALIGMSSLGCTSGRSCSWNGWTLVSVVERQEQGAPDLMDREIKDPATA